MIQLYLSQKAMVAYYLVGGEQLQGVPWIVRRAEDQPKELQDVSDCTQVPLVSEN